MASAAVLVILLVWTLASLAMQCGFAAEWATRASRSLWFYFTPRWSLFTGAPALMDVAPYYREEVAPGQFGEWRAVEDRRVRRWSERIWLPDRRRGKTMGDMARLLIELRLTGRRAEAPGSRPYETLLAYVRAHAQAPAGARVQFCLMTEARDWPAEDSRVLFLSEVHGT